MLPPDQIARLRGAAELTVDLEALTIEHPSGLRIGFDFDAHDRETLLQGLDDIARTLRREAEITAYEQRTPPRFDTRTIPA